MMSTRDPMELLVRAYQQTRLQEADHAQLRRLAHEGRADTSHHQDLTLVRLAARVLALGAIAILAALVTMVTTAALLVANGQSPTL